MNGLPRKGCGRTEEVGEAKLLGELGRRTIIWESTKLTRRTDLSVVQTLDLPGGGNWSG